MKKLCSEKINLVIEELENLNAILIKSRAIDKWFSDAVVSGASIITK